MGHELWTTVLTYWTTRTRQIVRDVAKAKWQSV